MRSICLCFLPVVTMAASADCWLFPPTRYNQKIQSSWSWTHKCNEVVCVRVHLLSSLQEQRGLGWEYLTGCYHLFTLPQAIHLTLSKICHVTFQRTRSFDVLRPNSFFRDVSSYFPKTETILSHLLCAFHASLSSLICHFSLIEVLFLIRYNKRSYLYLSFHWRQCVMTSMEVVVFVFHIIVLHEKVKWIVLYSDTHWHFLFVIWCW